MTTGPQAIPATDDAVDPAALTDETGFIEEDSLIEEVSIDGMCGVY